MVSLQPFGCIANHIISKGIETKIKRRYPHMNLLFLDFDADTSRVNIHNRLYFMIKNSRDELAKGQQSEARQTADTINSRQFARKNLVSAGA